MQGSDEFRVPGGLSVAFVRDYLLCALDNQCSENSEDRKSRSKINDQGHRDMMYNRGLEE